MKYNLRSQSLFLLPIIQCSSNHRFFIACALVSLMGCSGASYVQVDAHQPVYFGSPPKGTIVSDSAQMQFIRPLEATTSHLAEKEKKTTVKHIDITTGGVDKTESSVELEIARAFEEDPDRFISDVSICARVEAYIPWDTVVFALIGLIFSQEAIASGGTDATSETITITGKVYRQWGDKR